MSPALSGRFEYRGLTGSQSAAPVPAFRTRAAERVDVARSELAGGDLAGDARRERAEDHVDDAIARLREPADGGGRPDRVDDRSPRRDHRHRSKCTLARVDVR